MLSLAHGRLPVPSFLPDATRGVVRSLDAADLERCGVPALMMNVFHLMQRPGSSTLRAGGGLHRWSGWTRPIATDSGGFQAYSVVRADPRLGRVSDDGLAWRQAAGGREFRLTPEKSVRLQVSYGSDLVTCLDDCTHPDDSPARQEDAVKRTLAWARRSRTEFDRLLEQKQLGPERRPLLFAVIQGGISRELRARCATELLEIGFDGYGFGGWPLDAEGELLEDLFAFVRALVPAEVPMHALGVGHPSSIARCAALGYALFDSALPTRDARRGRLWTFARNPAQLDPARESEWLAFRYVTDAAEIKDTDPLSRFCDALCCARYTASYLHHLYRIEDALYPRLATLHNLRFMMQLLGRLRGESLGGG